MLTTEVERKFNLTFKWKMWQPPTSVLRLKRFCADKLCTPLDWNRCPYFTCKKHDPSGYKPGLMHTRQITGPYVRTVPVWFYESIELSCKILLSNLNSSWHILVNFWCSLWLSGVRWFLESGNEVCLFSA